MSQTKAVVFTHIPVAELETATIDGLSKFIDDKAKHFIEYLKCRNIGLVYAYIDVGIRKFVRVARESGPLKFSLVEIETEERIRNALKLSVDQAVLTLESEPDSQFDRRDAPRFQFVGLPHLVSLLNALMRINPQMVQSLAGRRDVFTYDSPKFVEAVIRLVRGQHPIHAQYPIMRFDADVKVNEDAIGKILSQAVTEMNFGVGNYHFFSGGYGRRDGIADPKNDFAVRVHWLLDDSGQLKPGAEKFLEDLSALGANQGLTGARSPQVISGAGLVMSLLAIKQLPPFMNVDNQVVWIDDHLKRRLHEAVDHLPVRATERVPDAKVSQDRPDSTLEWTKKEYFPRLLRGCLMHALIVPQSGRETLFSGYVLRAIKKEIKTITKTEWRELRSQLAAGAAEALEKVMSIWKTANYGDDTLKNWANSPSVKPDDICKTSADDAVSYLRLVLIWKDYVAAIEDLQPFHAYWLFRRV